MILWKFILITTILFCIASACTIYLLVDMYLATYTDAMEIAQEGDLSTEVDTLGGE